MIRIQDVGKFWISVGELREHGRCDDQAFAGASEGDLVRGFIADASAGVWAGIVGFDVHGQIDEAAHVYDGRHMRFMRQTQPGYTVWVPGDEVDTTDCPTADGRVAYRATVRCVDGAECYVKYHGPMLRHRVGWDKLSYVSPSAIVVVAARFLDMPMLEEVGQ